MLYMLLFALLYTNSVSQRTYKAMVVEYAPIRELKQLPRQVVEKNAAEYVTLIGDAGAQGANIIIFPEYGLTTLEATTKVSDHLDSYSIEIPAAEENITQNPCNNSKGNYSYHKGSIINVPLSDIDYIVLKQRCSLTFSAQNLQGQEPVQSNGNLIQPPGNSVQILRDICRAANQSNIYVVIHVVEKEVDVTEERKFKYFSTNLIFDTHGTIIKRYRKINLHNEQNFSSGAEKVEAFRTDFGVTFGLFVGADILHQNSTALLASDPEVTDVIYSTAWNSEMPFLNGLSLQDGFGKVNNINLLAACLNEASSNSTGSGIFLSNGSQSVIISSTNKTETLTQNVPIRTMRSPGNICQEYKEDVVSATNEQSSTIHTLIENLENYTMEDIGNQGNGNSKVCSGNFCCFFRFVIDWNSPSNSGSSSNYVYKLTAFFGSRQFGSRTIGVSVCAIVACENKLSCGGQAAAPPVLRFRSIAINATYKGFRNVYVQPLSAKYSLRPTSNFSYCKYTDNSETSVNISTVSLQDSLLTFGFFSRIYSNDNLPAGRLKCNNQERRRPDIKDSNDTESNSVMLILIIIVVLTVIIMVSACVSVMVRRRYNRMLNYNSTFTNEEQDFL